ncbi:MAG TPA: helix-turn-helix transcriptional regulator [Chthonomonadaceae bacterium]|nr:helix-turn-helix transcriptional regulator [Chthonomonadaceae bacterium]
MDTKTATELGQYLLSLRKDRGLSLEAAGKRAGISGTYIYKIEKGLRGQPSQKVLISLAEVYGIDPQKLLRQAGYVSAHIAPIPPERIEWAFEAVRRDPAYNDGIRLKAADLPIDAKAFIVELYQKASGRTLLLPTETTQVQEALGGEKRWLQKFGALLSKGAEAILDIADKHLARKQIKQAAVLARTVLRYALCFHCLEHPFSIPAIEKVPTRTKHNPEWTEAEQWNIALTVAGAHSEVVNTEISGWLLCLYRATEGPDGIQAAELRQVVEAIRKYVQRD